MIIKDTQQKGYDVNNWLPTSITVSPQGDAGLCNVTFGVFKDRAEYQKDASGLLASQEITVTVPTKVLTDLISAIEQQAVNQADGFFEGCPIQP